MTKNKPAFTRLAITAFLAAASLLGPAPAAADGDWQATWQSSAKTRIPDTPENKKFLAQADACADLDCFHGLLAPLYARMGTAFGNLAARADVKACETVMTKSLYEGLSCAGKIAGRISTQIRAADSRYLGGERVADMLTSETANIPEAVASEIGQRCGSPTQDDAFDSCAGAVLDSAADQAKSVKNGLTAALNRVPPALYIQEKCTVDGCKDLPGLLVTAFRSSAAARKSWSSAGTGGTPGAIGQFASQGSASDTQGIVDPTHPVGGNGDAVLGGGPGGTPSEGSSSRYASPLGLSKDDIPDTAPRARKPDDFLDAQCMNDFPLPQKQQRSAWNALDAGRFQAWACKTIDDADLGDFQKSLLPAMNLLSAHTAIELLRAAAIKKFLEARRQWSGRNMTDAEIASDLKSCASGRPPLQTAPLNGIEEFSRHEVTPEQKDTYNQTMQPGALDALVSAAQSVHQAASEAQASCDHPHPGSNFDVDTHRPIVPPAEYERELQSYRDDQVKCLEKRREIGGFFTLFPLLTGRATSFFGVPLEKNAAGAEAVLAAKDDAQKLRAVVENDLRPGLVKSLTDSLDKVCAMDWDDLAAITALADTVAATNPDLAHLLTCAQKRAAESKDAHAVAVDVGVGAFCFAAGAATAGVGEIACLSAALGTTVVKVESAREKRDWIQQCLAEGGSVCAMKDYEKARDEFESAVRDGAWSTVLGLAAPTVSRRLARVLAAAMKDGGVLTPTQLQSVAGRLRALLKTKGASTVAESQIAKLEIDVAEAEAIANPRAAPGALWQKDEVPVAVAEDSISVSVSESAAGAQPVVTHTADGGLRIKASPEIHISTSGRAHIEDTGKFATLPSVEINISAEELAMSPEDYARHVMSRHLDKGAVIEEVKKIGQGGMSTAVLVTVKKADGEVIKEVLSLPRISSKLLAEDGVSAEEIAARQANAPYDAALRVGIAEAEAQEGGGYIPRNIRHLENGVIATEFIEDGETLGAYVKQYQKLPPELGQTVATQARTERFLMSSPEFDKVMMQKRMRTTYNPGAIAKFNPDQIDLILERPHVLVPDNLIAEAASRKLPLSKFLRQLARDPNRKQELNLILQFNTNINVGYDSSLLYMFDKPSMKYPDWLTARLHAAREAGGSGREALREFLADRANAEKVQEILEMNMNLVKDTNSKVNPWLGITTFDR